MAWKDTAPVGLRHEWFCLCFPRTLRVSSRLDRSRGRLACRLRKFRASERSLVQSVPEFGERDQRGAGGSGAGFSGAIAPAWRANRKRWRATKPEDRHRGATARCTRRRGLVGARRIADRRCSRRERPNSRKPVWRAGRRARSRKWSCLGVAGPARNPHYYPGV